MVINQLTLKIWTSHHFKRIMEDLEKKAAISEEEVPSELDSLLMHMSKEADKVKHLKKRDKEKKKAAYYTFMMNNAYK
jgi:hypothetical protein